MKLLNTIQELIQEAEDNLYVASTKDCSVVEINKLEKSVEDSINLLKLYKDLY